ncbi:MAG TPA: glycoside hydrolase family 6 protein [Polyangiales bacterium]
MRNSSTALSSILLLASSAALVLTACSGDDGQKGVLPADDDDSEDDNGAGDDSEGGGRDSGSSRRDGGKIDGGDGGKSGARPGSSDGGGTTAEDDPPGTDPDNTGTPGGDPVTAARLDNPFTQGTGYVNPEWRAKAMAEPGGSRVADTSTAVWLDRIAAIKGTTASSSNGPMGLADHLDAALKQKASFATFVIYDLPSRDCSALASNGELAEGQLNRYKSEYIDAIAAIMGLPKYRGLRIVNVIEPDSLPNLVTNTNLEKCSQVKQSGTYVEGVAYALKTLGALPNVYNYIDAGHHGWLGWSSNMKPSAELFAKVAQQAGLETVHGFITNTANYSALKEPFFSATSMITGQSVRQSKWLDWNDYADELSYAQAFRTELISRGFPSSIGMLIDTSRNGWGGSKRPQAAASTSDLNGFVNGSRIDRRIHPGNWCNQSGAGLGERPRAAPEPGIDAYVWVKPPGESDGASGMIANNEGKGFDRMCDPTYAGNERNGNSATGALANAPLSGTWFSAQFRELMQNAYPAL